jgi:hypothetical protein
MLVDVKEEIILLHYDNCLFICNYGLLIYYACTVQCGFYALCLMLGMFCELAVVMHG